MQPCFHLPEKNVMPGKNPLTQQEKSAILGGTIATLAGLGLVLVSIDVIHADPDSFRTPRWVLTLTGMMFAFAGLSIFSRELFSPAEQRDPMLMWIQYILVIGMLAAFASVFLWVGLGPGEREFSSSVSFLFISISGKGNELIGRTLFGGCGIGVALITILAALGGARRIKNETARRDSTNE